MSKFSDQFEETKTLIHSNFKSNKTFGYSTLLHLQEQSSDDPSSIQILAGSVCSFISIIVADIFEDDEEIAAQALKCLGFTIYHPCLVASIPVDDAALVLESLVKLITVTKIKSICNLGVWCISVQQFNVQFLASHFSLLLHAVVHALDNPIGSLSTTFEAMQAVMKLASQLSEEMREFSSMWVPIIYRRLLSIDKRERDMSERCLLKISSTVFPPTLALSKTLTEDMKQKLLAGMKDLLQLGLKVQAIQAWGWFVRFLGSHATSTKNRRLINDMLKIPEQTFSDNNSQIQIATLVSWECLIDALIQPSLLACKTNAGTYTDIQVNGLSKSIKLIMTPLIGIISNKCDVSIHSCCLKAWRYLLHKLDLSINHPQVITLVLDPMFEAIFQTGPDGESVWLWNLCLDLLDDFALKKSQNMDYDPNGHVIPAGNHLSTSVLRPSVSCKFLLKQYAIKWLPWDLSLLDFFIKMISIIIRSASKTTVAQEHAGAVYNAALRIFRSVLKGFQMELKSESISYDRIMWCLNTIFRFIKRSCEDVSSEGSGNKGLHYSSLQFVETVTEELEPSLLGSPLYKMPLDLNYLDYLQSVHDIEHAQVLGISSIIYMDMVSPMVYLIAIYICVVVQSTLPETDTIRQGTCKFFKFMLPSLENLHVAIGLLYRHVGISHFQLWIALAKGLGDCIDAVKDRSLLKMDSDNTVYLVICHLLTYPFVVCSCTHQKLNPVKFNGMSEESLVLSQRKLRLENVIEVWMSLYGSIANSKSKFECSTKISFPEYLCLVLNGWIDKNTGILKGDIDIHLCKKDQDLDMNLLSLFGDAVICVLEHLTSEFLPDITKKNGSSDCSISNDINNRLGFVARFMEFSWTKTGAERPIGLTVNSRVFSALADFLNSLHVKQNIVSFIEILSSSLCQWLSHAEMKGKSIDDQVQVLWSETLNCLQRSQPQITFDSSFLKLQACLLEKTLDHPNASISEPSVTFWNSTYGRRIKLDYPQNLLPILDKLFRHGKISLHARSTSFLQRCYSRPPEDTIAAQRYKVTATNNRSTKRVELMENAACHFNRMDKLSSSFKRRRMELTEHQKG